MKKTRLHDSSSQEGGYSSHSHKCNALEEKEEFSTRKVLAITVALMIAALFTPALGYTIQSTGNQTYDVIAGARPSYSISSGVAAHNYTLEMAIAKMNIKAPAVQTTRVPYSFQRQDLAVPYSFNLVGVKGAPEGIQTRKEASVLGEAAKVEEATPAEVKEAPAQEAAETNASYPAVTTPPAAIGVPSVLTPAPAEATAAPANVMPAEQPKYSIAGKVMASNQSALADVMINLEQPAGTVIKSVNTTLDGKFIFNDLDAGEYTVSEVAQMGWMPVTPAEGKQTVTITNNSISDLEFTNEMQVVAPVAAPENMTAPANTTSNMTAPA
jgi:hypothetical protein